MIPAPFDYHRPESVEAAVKLIADLGDSARVIAGGHSLIPMMKMRMTDIAHLVDSLHALWSRCALARAVA